MCLPSLKGANCSGNFHASLSSPVNKKHICYKWGKLNFYYLQKLSGVTEKRHFITSHCRVSIPRLLNFTGLLNSYLKPVLAACFSFFGPLD